MTKKSYFIINTRIYSNTYPANPQDVYSPIFIYILKNTAFIFKNNTAVIAKTAYFVYN